jgi:hypothetical protein
MSKRRIKCRDCGREGQYGSFIRRLASPLPGWARRGVNRYGSGLCRNRTACVARTSVRQDTIVRTRKHLWDGR